MDAKKTLSVLKGLIEEVQQYSVPGDNWSYCTHPLENLDAYNTMWERIDSVIEELEIKLEEKE